MLGQLIKKEVLEHLMSLRFAIALVLCLVVILASLFVRVRDFNQTMDDFNQSVAAERMRLDTMEAPWSFPSTGVNVYERPNPLKVFIRGVDDENGAAVTVAGVSEIKPIIKEVQNTASALFPPIDVVAFAGLIMSLMAIVFGYDAVCGEKERGTLRLMLSYSVPRHTVLLAKWIGGYVTLMLPFLLTSLIGGVIVLGQDTISLSSSQWMRLMLIGGLAALYIAAMYSLALAVSCLTARASTSAMILLSLWVVLILAVPNLSTGVARIISPDASMDEYRSKVTTVGRTARDESRRKMREYDKEHGFGEPWWEGVNWQDREQMNRLYDRWAYEAQVEKEAYVDAINEYHKIGQQYDNRMQAQVDASRWVGRISPFSCFAMASAELADAGVLAQRRLQEQLAEYQARLGAYSFDEVYRMEMLGRTTGDYPTPWGQNRGNPIPQFTPAPPAATDYAKVVAPDVAILAGLVIVLFMVSYFKFLRYDVR